MFFKFYELFFAIDTFLRFESINIEYMTLINYQYFYEESSAALFNIMKSQRERFRVRNEQLEIENEQQQSQMQILQVTTKLKSVILECASRQGASKCSCLSSNFNQKIPICQKCFAMFYMCRDPFQTSNTEF